MFGSTEPERWQKKIPRASCRTEGRYCGPCRAVLPPDKFSTHTGSGWRLGPQTRCAAIPDCFILPAQTQVPVGRSGFEDFEHAFPRPNTLENYLSRVDINANLVSAQLLSRAATRWRPTHLCKVSVHTRVRSQPERGLLRSTRLLARIPRRLERGLLNQSPTKMALMI